MKKAAKKGGKKAPKTRPNPVVTPKPERPRTGDGPLLKDGPRAGKPLRPRLPDIRLPKPGEQPEPSKDAWTEIENIPSETPLLLLPVQLETIFDEEDGEPALKIRIYPDAISVDALTRGLREQEMEAGAAYWSATRKRREALKLEMIERFGARRAAWAAEATRPDRKERPQEAKTEEPARPALLPYRWIARGYRNGEVVFTQPGAPVSKGITMSPNPEGKPWKDSPEGLPVDEDMAWTVSYERAVEQGMAITVPLAELPEILEGGLDFLIVVGVREESKGTTAEVERLFDAHHYTSGLELLAQGSPTNNTESVDSAWSLRAADERLFERVIEGADRSRKAAFDGMRLAQALGLGKESTLAKALGAGRQEETAAAAMNEALWPAVWGEYLQNMLAKRNGRALPQASVRFARQWFLAHVRGGATLPTLRVRAQPYGVLPVRAAVERPKLETNQDALEDFLRVVRELWLDAAPEVARIDPNLADTGGQADNSPESRLAEVFLLQPHAVRFVIRKLTDRRDQGPLLGWATSLVGGFTFLLDVLCSLDLYQGFGNIYRRTESAVETIDDQIAGFEALRDFAPTYFSGRGEAQTRDNAIVIVDLILDILRDHQKRQAPLDALEGVTTSGILHEDVDDPTIFYSLFAKDDDARIFERPLVEAEEPAESERAAAYLENLAQRALGQTPAAPQFPNGEPLLYQLLDPFATTLPTAQRRSFGRAVRRLSQFPADELELRLRETLGLGSYRLDAWFTSLARKRLSDIREKQPEALAAGGFGLVLDLRPSKANKASQGFIHAPSQAQAVTAAVLRSGWSAHGTPEADSPLAVNLESSRVRTGRLLLDGVRQGQSLGDLLGARFERRLHDLHLDHYIAPLRRRVLDVATDGRGPGSPVDGLELRDLFTQGALDDLTGDSALAGALEELDQWLDSTVDAGTAESVHQLAAGNTARAAAMLRSINTGDTRPPQLLGLETPRRGPVVENRIIALLESTTSRWAMSPRKRMAPELDAWCGRLLGAPMRIGCRVDAQPPNARKQEIFITMAALGVSALDVVFESELGAATAWKTRAEAAAAEAAKLPAGTTYRAVMDDAGRAAVSFQEAAETAAAIHEMLGRSRPLAPADLASPGDEPEATWDVSTLRTRTESLADEFATWLKSIYLARERGETAATLRDLALAGRAYGGSVGAAVAAATGPGADGDTASVAVLAAGQKVQGTVSKLLREAARADDPVDKYRAVVTEIFGKAFPVTCAFTLGAAEAFPAAVGRDGELIEHAEVAELWLRQVARVREPASHLREARDLASLLGSEPEALRVAQLPMRAGEGWAAVSLPERETGGRVSFALVGDAPTGRRFTGLFVDGWSERIPDAEQTTAVAFHHDSPSARPPQTVLLAVTPEGQKWSLSLLCSTLMQTIELAQLRCVSPAELGDWGHHLPAIFSPHSIEAEAVEAGG